jgi:hypothetical protein
LPKRTEIWWEAPTGCDDKEEYEKERSKIKERLTQRGYNSNLIEKQLLKVDELDRKETLKYRKLENLSSIFILGCIEFARSWNFFNVFSPCNQMPHISSTCRKRELR